MRRCKLRACVVCCAVQLYVARQHAGQSPKLIKVTAGKEVGVCKWLISPDPCHPLPSSVTNPILGHLKAGLKDTPILPQTLDETYCCHHFGSFGLTLPIFHEMMLLLLLYYYYYYEEMKWTNVNKLLDCTTPTVIAVVIDEVIWTPFRKNGDGMRRCPKSEVWSQMNCWLHGSSAQ